MPRVRGAMLRWRVEAWGLRGFMLDGGILVFVYSCVAVALIEKGADGVRGGF